jgi:Protein kinase domain/WD40-like Beta Propeller Repeat
MGEVLEAVRTGPGGFRMPVALKRLMAEDAIRGEIVQRFFAEARILARLDHPNIVRVHDVLAVDAGYFIVMELLRGVTLADLALAAHRSGARAPWPEVLAVADQALAGLAYAHAACGDDGRPLGLIHRDVTPRNLFVTETGVVKLLDFGIAKLHERLEVPITREGTVHGTLELLSPEQAAGESADASTDLYQLGAAIYWSLAARYPHGSGSAPELLARIISGSPRPLAELRPDLPAAVVGLIDRAMARERGDRFGSAIAMREAVAAVLGPTGAAAADLARAVAALPAEAGGVRSTEDGEEGRAAAPTASTAALSSTGALTPTAALATTVAVEGAPSPPTTSAGSTRRIARWPLATAALLGAAAIAVVAWSRWSGRGPGEAEGSRATVREVMLTLAAGDQQPTGSGGLSADARRLVYATGNELVVKPVPGGRAERLALPAGFHPMDAEFAPDGRVVAYGQNQSGEWQVWRLGGGPLALLHATPTRFLVRLSPDGAAIAMAHDERSIRLLAGGRSRELVDLEDGEMVSAMAWSPDGRQLAFVRTEPHGGDDRIEIIDVAAAPDPGGADEPGAPPRVIRRRSFATYVAVLLAWPEPGRLLYAINDRLGANLYSLDLASGEERPVYRWAGLTISGGRWSGGRLVCNRGTRRYGIFVGERGGPLHRLSTGDGQTRRLAGWTDQGWLFYANDAAGNLDIVAHPPDARPALWMSSDADEMPDTLVDGSVIFQRGEAGGGSTVGLWRSTAPGDARRLATVSSSGMSANAVRCAGDRRPPCVVEQVDGERARFALFDPNTGARGREIAAVPTARGGPYQRNMALSPDGATLALVNGGDTVLLFDAAGGARTELAVAGASDLQSVSWSADGRDLLVTSLGWRGRLFAALRVALDGAVEPIDASQQRWYWRAQESVDGKRLAAVALEFATELAMLEGI